MRRIFAGLVALPFIAAACGGPTDVGSVSDLNRPGFALVSPPSGPGPETIVVCKVGGTGGTFDFSVTGFTVENFSLDPGQCWQLGVHFGGAGGSVDITEAAEAGFVLDSIVVDQLLGADSKITNSNTASSVDASGTPAEGAVVTFYNSVEEETGLEGCTPGYWKQEQHFDSWPAGVDPDDLFTSVFTVQLNDGLDPTLTLAEALALNGGGANALARHAVAAYLNALNPDVDYPLTSVQVVALVNAAFLSNNYEGAKNTLEGHNELGCPLN